jgi:hypothetical protein
MKRKILFAALNLVILSNSVQASQEYLPCNIAYSIAGLAGALEQTLKHEEAGPNGIIEALHDVKVAYDELGTYLLTSYYLDHEASLLFAVAAAALDHVHQKYADNLMKHHDVIQRMLGLNKRLAAGI